MTDLLKEGSAWLEQQRTAHCSSQVSYFVGAAETVLNATFGKTDFEVADESVTTISQVWDFLILAADLGFDPAPGHVIVTGGRKYEVMQFGSDAKGWRWSDPYRETYRIHTKGIGAA